MGEGTPVWPYIKNLLPNNNIGSFSSPAACVFFFAKEQSNLPFTKGFFSFLMMY
jgi:hypothetical protein